MSHLATAVGYALLTLAMVGVVYTVASGMAVSWFFSRPASTPTEFPDVTILKPLHGDEPGLRACLEGFCTQAYPGAVQVVFGVRDAQDAAIPVVRALAADHPDLALDLVIDPRLYGTNHKISNLINMQGLIRHPVVVLADSDIAVEPDYLRRLVGALSKPGVGFVSCVSIGRPTGNGWSRFSAMAMDYHFLPSVALGLRLGIAKPCFGPTIALLRSTLEEIGGFHPFADLLADDFEIGRAIRTLGHGFSIPPLAIGHGCPERSLDGLFGHELRWSRTIRVIDPLSYAASAVCHPLPGALAAAVLLQGEWAGWLAVALTLASRVFVASRVDGVLGGRRSAWSLLPARDLMSAAIWASAFFVKTVDWRGRRFEVGRTGVLTMPVARTPSLGVALGALTPAIVPAALAGARAAPPSSPAFRSGAPPGF